MWWHNPPRVPRPVHRRRSAQAGTALLAGLLVAGCGTATTTARPAAPGPRTPPAVSPAPESTVTGRPSGTAAPTSDTGGGPRAPMHSRVTTGKRVVYLTIDDGFIRDPALPAFLRAHHLPVTAFLVGAAVRGHTAYFKRLAAAGAEIENHTLTHPDLTRLSPAAQRHQICGNAAYQRRVFHHRPTLLRPPYGAWDARTARAARTCGTRDIVMWGIEVRDHAVHYAGPHRLQSGDIILLHFRPGLTRDLRMILTIAHEQGFRIARLPRHFH